MQKLIELLRNIPHNTSF